MVLCFFDISIVTVTAIANAMNVGLCFISIPILLL